jgi:hypothetical protein
VGVDVNKSWRHQSTRRINLTSCSTDGAGLRDLNNHATADGDISRSAFGPGAIDEVTIAKNEVVHGFTLPSRQETVQVFAHHVAEGRKRGQRTGGKHQQPSGVA